MATVTPIVKVLAPAEKTPFGRGFYQLEEEALYLPVEYPEGRLKFFSFLDSKTTSFHLDRDGRLIFIEITLPRRRWRVRDNFIPPDRAEAVDLRWLDFRETIAAPTVFCNTRRDQVMLRFGRGPAVRNVRPAENLIAQIGADNRLVTIWAFDIVDDLAGREIAGWRRAVHGERKFRQTAPRTGSPM